jgi:hypothetical protein
MAVSVSGVGLVPGLIGEAVNRWQCILLLGAGMHAPPASPFSYPVMQRPTIGKGLSRELQLYEVVRGEELEP